MILPAMQDNSISDNELELATGGAKGKKGKKNNKKNLTIDSKNATIKPGEYGTVTVKNGGSVTFG